MEYTFRDWTRKEEQQSEISRAERWRKGLWNIALLLVRDVIVHVCVIRDTQSHANCYWLQAVGLLLHLFTPWLLPTHPCKRNNLVYKSMCSSFPPLNLTQVNITLITDNTIYNVKAKFFKMQHVHILLKTHILPWCPYSIFWISIALA